MAVDKIPLCVDVLPFGPEKQLIATITNCRLLPAGLSLTLAFWNQAMVDVYSEEKRSQVMSRVRGKNTKPEKRVRSALHRAGYRFRLHRADLPGKPDIVLPLCRTVIFVNGCFWHQHPGCRRATIPASNRKFWKRKLTRTVERDEQNRASLRELGWNIITIWECEIHESFATAMNDLLTPLIGLRRQTGKTG